MFTREELQALAEGLDSLARNAKDVIIASVQLAPLRRKLDAIAKSLDQQFERSSEEFGNNTEAKSKGNSIQ